MERDRDELEEILPESSTRLVSLNTRIPLFVDEMILQSVGILQTESQYLKVSKQVAVQILIERGFQAIKEDFERMDREQAADEQVVVRIERTPQPQRSFDMKVYAEMANKTVYEPRRYEANRSQSETKTLLQKSLGLR